MTQRQTDVTASEWDAEFDAELGAPMDAEFDDDLNDEDDDGDDGDSVDLVMLEELTNGGPMAIGLQTMSAIQAGAYIPMSTGHAEPNAREYGAISYLSAGVVTVPVDSLLVPRECWLTERYGATSYQSIVQDVTAAMDDARVRGVVLAFTSPGGQLHGCFEAVTALRAMRGRKPLQAIVQGNCFGAAYWLASVCDRMVAESTAMVGDLGVQVRHIDDSKRMAQAGLQEIIITSSATPRKNAAPTTDEGHAAVQQLVDDLAGVMLTSIAENRGLTVDALVTQGGNGTTYAGTRALTVGLVDAIGYASDVQADVRSGQSATTAKATAKNNGRKLAPPAPTGAERIIAAIRTFNPNALVTPTAPVSPSRPSPRPTT